MKKYKCHEVVEAGKIHNLVSERSPNGKTTIVFEDMTTIEKPNCWFSRHPAEIGGYFVRYRDGYESFSPAKIFEEIYQIIGE